MQIIVSSLHAKSSSWCDQQGKDVDSLAAITQKMAVMTIRTDPGLLFGLGLH